MMEKRLKVFSGIFAFAAYFVLVTLLLYYFNHHSEKKAVHYVEKNDNRIEVTLGGEKKKSPAPKKKRKPKKNKKPKPKTGTVKKARKHIPKKTEKAVKKSVDSKKKKQANVHSLFAGLNEKKPEKKSVETERKKRISESFKNIKSSDQGIKNAYFAKVEKMLQGWPAQSEFAGETVKVWLKIEPDGSFDFKVLSASNNEEFNRGLIQYLKQLQKVGFDPHQNSKAYELNVEFVAKE